VWRDAHCLKMMTLQGLKVQERTRAGATVLGGSTCVCLQAHSPLVLFHLARVDVLGVTIEVAVIDSMLAKQRTVASAVPPAGHGELECCDATC
jgi:hypothetical protein